LKSTNEPALLTRVCDKIAETANKADVWSHREDRILETGC